MTDKTTAALKLAEEALEDAYRRDEHAAARWVYEQALAAIRETLAEPVTISCDCGDIYERNSFGGKFIQQYGCCPNCDAAKPVQEPVAWLNPHNQAVIDVRKKKQIGEGKGYPNFSIPLYAAPVERQWVELTDDEMWDVFINKDWTGEPLQLMSAVIAAFKDKNK